MQIRRRRLGAAAALVVLVLIAVVLATSGSPAKHHTPPVAKTEAKAKRQVTEADIETKSLAAVGSVRAYTPFVKEGSARVRDIALTFDDGPGPYTIQLLKVLERYHVKATFFEIGKMLQYFGDATVREIEDGDVIGDHTETHPFMATLSAHDQYEELFEQIARIELAGGRRPTLFRPPYGSFNATTMRQLAKLHLLMVLWSADTDDYLQPGVPVIVERALAGAHPGAIILMHDAGGTRTQTIEALPADHHQTARRGLSPGDHPPAAARRPASQRAGAAAQPERRLSPAMSDPSGRPPIDLEARLARREQRRLRLRRRRALALALTLGVCLVVGLIAGDHAGCRRVEAGQAHGTPASQIPERAPRIDALERGRHGGNGPHGPTGREPLCRS